MNHRLPEINARSLVEKAVNPDWRSNYKGIYADFSDGWDHPKYYCKCPNCNYVHGDYRSPSEAFYNRLCNLCKRNDALDWHKQVLKAREPAKKKKRPNSFSLRIESIVRALLD